MSWALVAAGCEKYIIDIDAQTQMIEIDPLIMASGMFAYAYTPC